MNDKVAQIQRYRSPLGVNEVKSALGVGANTLRGSAVDRTDWKGCILPLLFFKRISDVWDEETAEAQEIYGEADPGDAQESGLDVDNPARASITRAGRSTPPFPTKRPLKSHPPR